MNPLYVELRRLRAKSAASEWNAVLGIEPEILRVSLNVRTNVLTNRQVLAATVADPQIATVSVPPGGNGLLVTGLQNGGALLEVTFVNGAVESFVLMAGAGPQQEVTLNAATAGWTAWSLLVCRQLERPASLCAVQQ